MNTYTSPFKIGQRVYVDEDKSICAIVVGLWFLADNKSQVSISWWFSGDLKTAVVDSYRLKAA